MFNNHQRQLSILAALLCALFFIFDIMLPLGIAGGVPYIALVILGVWFSKRHHIYTLAAIGSAFTVIGYFMSPQGADMWVVLTNRTLAIAAIWVTAILISLRNKAENLTEEAKEEADQANQTLRKLSQAVEQSPATVLITDLSGKIEYVNPKFEKVTGYTFDEVVGLSSRILSSGKKSQEEYKEFWETITSGNEWRGEFHNQRKDGSLYWEFASISPIRDTDGKISNFLAIKEDITNLKNIEADLRRAKKMEAVGQLTGGIAHDFNNILGVVMGNLEILRRMVVGDEKALKRVEIALKGAKRGADITKKLLSFSSMGTYGASLTMVNPFIRNLHELIAKSLTALVIVETHLADDLWAVALDPGDLEDAILNLSINARDAMPDGGTLIIETANKVLDEEYILCNPDAAAGEFIMISVSDTGTGMTDEVRERVLEPFFTTKEQGKGTGLGLSMVYGFVQRSGGHLKICSEVGKGTTIRIYLPRVQEEACPNNVANNASTDFPRGRETILVVDDEEGLLDIAVTHLEGLGYKILSATTGDQALNILRANKDIDLLFSDIIMPGDLDGYQLALIAHEENSVLKILLASGFTKNRGAHVSGENKFLAQLSGKLLSKPYSQSELAIAIRRNLNEEK